MMSQPVRNAVDVVLDVPPVIIEIRIAVPGCRREQDVETPLMPHPAHARADRTRDHAVDDERPLEIRDEPIAEVVHLASERSTILQQPLDPVPSQANRGAEQRGTDENEREFERAIV